MIVFKKSWKSSALVLTLSALTSVLFVNCSGKGFEGSYEPMAANADPLLPLLWHLNNYGQKTFSDSGGSVGNDIQVSKTWDEGTFGQGIRVLISDDGIDNTHEDLASNFATGSVHLAYAGVNMSLASAAPPINLDDNHGTNVSGLVAAARNNSVGITGVAPAATLVASNFLSKAGSQAEVAMIQQAAANVDVVNMSWGSNQDGLSTEQPLFRQSLEAGTQNGRSGLGRVYVKASGNDYLIYCKNNSAEICVGNANFDSDNSTPYTILVSAVAAEAVVASYSSPGSNVWVAAPGGENTEAKPNIVTTDRMGCNVGEAKNSSQSRRAFERGGDGNEGCRYTTNFAGTSAAAPIVSGAVALILQANPTLNWREVKHVLAATATPVKSVSTGHPLRYRMPAGHVYEQDWVTNTAGYAFHNWYGFGRINVDAAVERAKNFGTRFGPLQISSPRSSSTSVSIPDNSAQGNSTAVNVPENFIIEAVQIQVTIDHPRMADIGLELTSPSGTKSIILNVNNSLRTVTSMTNRQFLSNAFYGERSNGNWTLRAIDGREVNTGTLDHWQIVIYGRN